MPTALALFGAWSIEEYRTTFLRFLTDHAGAVHSIEINLFDLHGVRFDTHEWRPEENDTLGGIAEQIFSYILEHQSASARIRVRCDG